jgi:hypothetical protein
MIEIIKSKSVNYTLASGETRTCHTTYCVVKKKSFSKEDVDKMNRMRSKGYTKKAIASRFGICVITLNKYLEA